MCVGPRTFTTASERAAGAAGSATSFTAVMRIDRTNTPTATGWVMDSGTPYRRFNQCITTPMGYEEPDRDLPSALTSP